MKKVLLVLSIFLSTLSFSQSYKTAIGVKGGYPGYGSLNAKHYFSGSSAVEASIGGGSNFLWLQGLYEINQALPTDGLNWYLGVGPSIELGNTNNNSGLILSATGVIGIEYTFQDLPINIALDTGPNLKIIPALGFDWRGAIAIRYTLK
jgi:hypothetical protein